MMDKRSSGHSGIVLREEGQSDSDEAKNEVSPLITLPQQSSLTAENTPPTVLELAANGSNDRNSEARKIRTPVPNMDIPLEYPVDEPERLSRFVVLLTILSAIGGFLFGYDTGVISGAMILLKEEFHLSSSMQELVVSITIAGAAVFAFVGGWLNNRWGRKPVILLASAVFTFGAIFMAVSWATWVLLVGRLVVGIGIGLVSMTIPVYLAENAPAHLRGRMVTVNTVFVTGGQFIAACCDALLVADRQHGWRYMLGIAGIPSLLQFVGFLFLPDSPRFLISKQRYEEARKALHQTIGTKDANVVERRLQELTSAYTMETEIHKEQLNRISPASLTGGGDRRNRNVFINIFTSKPVRRALFVGCGLQVFQQITGINTVMYYSATIIQLAGVQGTSLILWLSALTAGVNFVCTFIGLYLVEKLGRRPLTLLSIGGVMISLLILALGFQFSAMYSPPVTTQETIPPSIGSDVCTIYLTCDQCQRSHCGYCYADVVPSNATADKFLHALTELQPLASCVAINKSSPDSIALYGRCTNASAVNTGGKSSLHWLTESCPSRYSVMAVVGLIVYLFFFAPGMGPMPWTINSEIYPTWARSTCNSIATTTNWVFNLIISFTFLTLTEVLTKYGAFYLYTSFAVCGLIFVYTFLPETKGQSLEDIQDSFENDDKWWSRMPRCCRPASRRNRHET